MIPVSPSRTRLQPLHPAQRDAIFQKMADETKMIPGKTPSVLPRKKKTWLTFHGKYWLVNRDPCFMVYYNPYING